MLRLSKAKLVSHEGSRRTGAMSATDVSDMRLVEFYVYSIRGWKMGASGY